MPADESRLITTSLAAAMLGVKPRVIYEWARVRNGKARLQPAGRRGVERLWDVDQVLDAERDMRERRPVPRAKGDLSPRRSKPRDDYATAHSRVRNLRGKASAHTCQHCGATPATQWAYDHSDPDELSGPSGPYSLDIARYRPLCTGCHRDFDGAAGSGRDAGVRLHFRDTPRK